MPEIVRYEMALWEMTSGKTEIRVIHSWRLGLLIFVQGIDKESDFAFYKRTGRERLSGSQASPPLSLQAGKTSTWE